MQRSEHQLERERLKKVVGIMGATVLLQYFRRIRKRQCYTRQMSGAEVLKNILEGNEVRCYNKLRMKPVVFYALCDLLHNSYGLKPVGNLSIMEQVAHFLQYVGQAHSYRHIAEEYQHSTWTICRSIRSVLNACLKMVVHSICLFRPHSVTPPEIENDGRYSRYFQNCVGAIDGTHVNVVLSSRKIIPFIGRMGKPTQNIMAARDFNMCFTFIAPGWEGAAHDSKVLNEAINNPRSGFQMPPRGKYYLVDSGYANRNGFLAPYRKQRYHLPAFQSDPTMRNGQEMFNYKHSSLQSVIERSFAVWKKKFKIVNHFPSPLSFRMQVKLVVATMALHNFVRIMNMDDPDFLQASVVYDAQDPIDQSEVVADNIMDGVRDSIRQMIEADAT